MDDGKILDLYIQRNEMALSETSKKYHTYCASISKRILHNSEDEEECVNDTWLNAWNAIPPAHPSCFRTYLGAITRNLSLTKLRLYHKQRKTESAGIIEEMQECLTPNTNLQLVDGIVITDVLNKFLDSLTSSQRILFVQRYWYCCPVKDLASRNHISEGNVKMQLLRLRERLKLCVEKEGIAV